MPESLQAQLIARSTHIQHTFASGLELKPSSESDSIEPHGAVGVDRAAGVEPKLGLVAGSQEHPGRTTDGLSILDAESEFEIGEHFSLDRDVFQFSREGALHLVDPLIDLAGQQ